MKLLECAVVAFVTVACGGGPTYIRTPLSQARPQQLQWNDIASLPVSDVAQASGQTLTDDRYEQLYPLVTIRGRIEIPGGAKWGALIDPRCVSCSDATGASCTSTCVVYVDWYRNVCFPYPDGGI